MSFGNMPLNQFLEALGADTAAPGGGSAAAMAGAMAASLCSMVAGITLSSEKYKGAWDDMRNIHEISTAAAKQLTELIDRDTAAYMEVMAAYKLPRATEEEKKRRSAAIQEALKRAASVPLETLKAVRPLIESARKLIDKANPNCLTDTGVAVLLITAAAKGAAYNVRVNLSSISDEVFCKKCSREVDEILGCIEKESLDLQAIIDTRLG